MPIQCMQCKKLASELTELKKSYREVKKSYLASVKAISEMVNESRSRYAEMTLEIACLKDELARCRAKDTK